MNNEAIADRRENIEPLLEERQRELREALEDLQAVVARRLDMSAYLAARPVPWLVGAFLFGVWLGSRRP